MPDKFSIAFYNLENFFDTIDDPKTADNPFTPKGFMHWIKKRYFNKAKKIGYVIGEIGKQETGRAPLLIGLGEVENKKVLHDLLQSKYLKNIPYAYVHFDSKDRRGMDVALLYHKETVQVHQAQTYPLVLYTNQGKAYDTRDILYVEATIFGVKIHLLINHWPSRREGDFESDFKRLQAARLLQKIIDQIAYEEMDARIIIMGDFNTDPTDKHIQAEIVGKRFFNPIQANLTRNSGSLNHQGVWHLFDQILLTHNFKKLPIKFSQAHIFKPKYLKVWHGKAKNTPFRTYKGRQYQGGYSDHFPVYTLFDVLK